MEKYDFDSAPVRLGTHCVKWDTPGQEDVIPLWVADMDFAVAPCVQRAVAERAAHPVYGYVTVPDSYYEAVTEWYARRHDWQIETAWILHTPGVVAAVTCAIRALALPGEKVLILTPVYNCFFTCIANSGCQVAESLLRREGDTYVVDFDDFERQCADPKTTVFLLCNPHNPAGRVWTREELARMQDICQRHSVRVVADEIHCELVMPGHTFTPFGAVSPECLANSITLSSPSKAFNTAGLQMSNVICADPELRRRVDRVINIHEVCDCNPFGPVALEAAYREGAPWLDQLCRYVYENYLETRRFFLDCLPTLEVLRLEGTYLAWLDISALELTSDEAADLLLREARVRVCSGTMYGRRAGQGYLRINLACPRAQLMEGLRRMGRTLSAYLPDEADRGCPM